MKTHKPLEKNTFVLTGVYGFLWIGMSAQFGFFVPYLKSQGLSEIAIGQITSTLSIVGILGPVLWGALCDRVHSARWLIFANLVAGSLLAQLVPMAVAGPLLLPLLITLNLTVYSQSGILDGWAMRLRSRGVNLNYGLLRGTGSLTYALGSLLCGYLFQRFGTDKLYPFVLVAECAAAALILLVREPAAVQLAASTSNQTDAITVKAASTTNEPPLYRNAPYLIFVGFAMLLYLGQAPAMTFFPVLMEQAGGTTSQIGLANMCMALSEIPIMFLSSLLLKRFRDTTLLGISMGFFAVRLFVFFLSAHSVEALIWAQLTNSVSFGIFMPTSVHYISRVAPERKRTTALTVASSIYMGVGGFVGNRLGGIIIDAWGVQQLYAGAAALAAVATVAFAVALAVMERKKIVSSSEQQKKQ